MGLQSMPYDCVWCICEFSGDYRTIGCLGMTCTTLYSLCGEEFLWRGVAQKLLPSQEFACCEMEHERCLQQARLEWLCNVEDESDMSAFVPGFFKSAVRSFVLRSFQVGLQKFVDAALSCSENDIETRVKASQRDLSAFVSRVRDISFASCIGQTGALALAASFQLSNCQPFLKTIDLSNQLIRDKGAQALLSAFAAREEILCSIEKIVLRGNKLTDECSSYIGNFLECSVSRGSLRILDLSCNSQISDVTLGCLATSLQKALARCDSQRKQIFSFEQLVLDQTHIFRSRRPSGEFVKSATCEQSLENLMVAASVVMQTRRTMMLSTLSNETHLDARKLWRKAPFVISCRNCQLEAHMLSRSLLYVSSCVQQFSSSFPASVVPPGGVVLRFENIANELAANAVDAEFVCKSLLVSSSQQEVVEGSQSHTLTVVGQNMWCIHCDTVHLSSKKKSSCVSI